MAGVGWGGGGGQFCGALFFRISDDDFLGDWQKA